MNRVFLRTLRVWIAVAVIAICAGIGVCLRPPRQKGISQWIQALKRRDSRVDVARRRLWSNLPDAAQSVLEGICPLTTNVLQRAAWDALATIGPNDKESVDLLIRQLDDPFLDLRAWLSSDELHSAAHRAL